MWMWLALGCGAGRAPVVAQPALPTAPHMQEVLDRAVAAREAVVAGDVRDARLQLAWLADNAITSAPPPPAMAHLAEAVREAAATGANGAGLREVGIATASLARACGDCHDAVVDGPLFPAENLPPGEQIETHMLRHRWAVDRMWEGLVSPDDHRWRSGAYAFLEEPLVPEIVALTQVHTLGRAGLDASSREERAVLYGEILSSCAMCHQTHGVGPDR